MRLSVSKSETSQRTRRSLTESWEVLFLAGTGTAEQEATVHSRAIKWLRWVRRKCEDAVILRTGDSKDYLGKPIADLVSFEDHPHSVLLRDHEYDALERAAERATDNEAFVRWFASEVSQRTYFLREQADNAMWDAEFLPRHPEDAAAPVVWPTRGHEGECSETWD